MLGKKEYFLYFLLTIHILHVLYINLLRQFVSILNENQNRNFIKFRVAKEIFINLKKQINIYINLKKVSWEFRDLYDTCWRSLSH